MERFIQKIQHSIPRPSSPHLMELDDEKLKSQEETDLFDQLLQQHNDSMQVYHTHEQHIHHHFLHNYQMIDEGNEHPGCKCTKIDCLKLYCECFSKGRVCNQRCICVCCHNHPGNEQIIYKAMQVANFRNTGHFKGIPALISKRKCTCKKSSCQKNYCDCYRAGLKCGEHCQCSDCRNGKHHEHFDGFDQEYQIEEEKRFQIVSLA